MCELFAASQKNKTSLTDLLNVFFSHSDTNPDGWGVAYFQGDEVLLHKESVEARFSQTLSGWLEPAAAAQNMLAHIRLATRGVVDFESSHPFTGADSSGRTWTLIHNGTVFDSGLIDRFRSVQKGSTDSERILHLLIERINHTATWLSHTLTQAERFAVLDQMVCDLAPHNKINLIIFDGEILYTHVNLRGTLHVRERENQAVFSTYPLDSDAWRALPLNRLQAWKEGKCVATGTDHGHEFISEKTIDWAKRQLLH